MIKLIRPDYTMVPDDAENVTISAAVEHQLCDRWLEQLGKNPWDILVDECCQFHFDCGGIVHKDEPQMELELDGWKLSVFVRHAETLQAFCRKIQSHMPTLGEHVFFPGYWVKAILTVETGKQIEAWLASELPKRIAEADQWWAKHYETMDRIGIYVPPRREHGESE